MRFVSNWKVAVLLVLAFAGTLQARGCTDGEIIAGGLGLWTGAAIANSVNNAPRCRERLGRPEVVPVYDRRGRVIDYETIRRPYTECYRYKMGISSNSASEINVDNFAAANQLSRQAAGQIVDVLKTAETGDENKAKEALASICLNVEDFRSVANGGSFSAEKNDCIAKALNQDPQIVAKMVTSLIETGRAQQAARTQNHDN